MSRSLRILAALALASSSTLAWSDPDRGGTPAPLAIGATFTLESILHVAGAAERLRKAPRPSLNTCYEPMPGETHATLSHPAAPAAVRQLFKPVAGAH